MQATYQNGLGAGKVLGKLVPNRGHLLAVATPRGEELDEGLQWRRWGDGGDKRGKGERRKEKCVGKVMWRKWRGTYALAGDGIVKGGTSELRGGRGGGDKRQGKDALHHVGGLVGGWVG